jgi:hypothetical protein
VPQVHAEVIAKAIAALGGEAVLRGAKAVSWKTETTMVFNAVESRGKGQTTIMGLDHMRQEFEGEFGGNPFKAVTVVSGDKGGRVFGDNRLGLRADEIANEKRTLWTVVAPVLVLPLKAPSFRLESVADATVDGKPCAGVRVTGPDKKPFTLYFDKQSGLPARLVARMTGFMGEDYDQETLFSDYREVEGIRKAMRIVVKRDGERFLEQKLTEFRVLKDVPPATFEPPA